MGRGLAAPDGLRRSARTRNKKGNGLQDTNVVRVDEIVAILKEILDGRRPDMGGVDATLRGSLEEVADRLEGLAGELSELSPSDELTSLAKETVFNNVLWREFNRAQRYKEPLSLVLLEVDDFPRIEKSAGRETADKVLREVAGIVLQVIRETDLAARYGDDRFAVVMPQTALEGATGFIQRLRRAVEEEGISADGIAGSACISAGAATVPADGVNTAPDLVARASAALEAAKAAGHGAS